MGPYKGFDLLDIDSLLSEQERQVRDSVRTFVNRDVIPVVIQNFRDGSFPLDLIPKMADLGLFGAYIDGYDCAGVGPVAYGLAMQELERGDSGLRSFLSVHSSLAMGAIWLHGSGDQKDAWLSRMAHGEEIGAFCLTEADHGSDPSEMETTAELNGDGYIIDGSKFWISNGGIATVLIVWAKTSVGIRGFIVPANSPGVSISNIEGKLSMRASVTSSVIFEKVTVPLNALLAGSTGLGSALACLNQARYGIAWGVLGAAAACLHETIEYTKNRRQFGKPLAGFQLVQAKFADMAANLSMAQLLAYHLGRKLEAGTLHHTQISIAKYQNAQMALDIARTCRDLLGGAGILDTMVTMRHMVNLETVNTYEGTRHMHQLILGRHLTGLNAFA